MEETYFGYRLLLLGLIVILNAFFASAEMSLVSARSSRLREMATDGNLGAQAALNLLARPERLLSTLQVGVTLAGIGAGWAGEDTLYGLLYSAFQPLMTPQLAGVIRAGSVVLAFMVLTFFMVVIGEVVPKNLGMKQAERYAVAVAPLLLVFYRISGPFIYVLERSSAAISRLVGVGAGERTAVHSVEELKLIASSVRAAGRLTAFEESTVHRALDLQEISVRHVMVPRNDIVSISSEASLDHVLRVLTESQFTRVPVYEREPQRIIGILHSKDLLALWQKTRLAALTNAPAPPYRLRALLRRHLVVPESKPVSQMIDLFQQERAHMALVVDEFGTIAGLVTMEDVLEQIVGEIEDEHDVRRPRALAKGAPLELEGTASIRDLETQYGIELPANAGFETLAGFLLFRLGYLPSAGDTVESEGRRFTIVEMEGKRIARVRIETASPTPKG
jgi:putative hemolysin